MKRSLNTALTTILVLMAAVASGCSSPKSPSDSPGGAASQVPIADHETRSNEN